MRDSTVSVTPHSKARPAAGAACASKPALKTRALTGAGRGIIEAARGRAAEGLPAVALHRPAELPISERELALIGAWLADPFSHAIISVGPIQAGRVPPVALRLQANEVLDDGAWDVPFGYAVVRGQSGGPPIRLLPHPEEAEIVARVLHLASPSGGALSIRSTLAALNEAGDVGREGKPLTRSGVVTILTCSIYATGGLIPVRRRHARRCAACSLIAPALVDSDVFEEAKRAREGRRAENAAPRLTNGPTLLLGIARCGRCGGEIAMRTSDSGRARRIVCVGPAKASAGCGLAHAMEQVDRLVLDAVADAALAPKRAAILAAALNARSGDATALLAARRRSTRDRVDQARTRADQILRRHPEDKPVALGTLRHLMATEGAVLSGSVRVQAYERALADLRAGAPIGSDALPDLMRQRIASASPEARKRWCRLYVDAVTLDVDQVTITLKGAQVPRLIAGAIPASPPQSEMAERRSAARSTAACAPLNDAPPILADLRDCEGSWAAAEPRHVSGVGFTKGSQPVAAMKLDPRPHTNGATASPAARPLSAVVPVELHRPGGTWHSIRIGGCLPHHFAAPAQVPAVRTEEHPMADASDLAAQQGARWNAALRLARRSLEPPCRWPLAPTVTARIIKPSSSFG